MNNYSYEKESLMTTLKNNKTPALIATGLILVVLAFTFLAPKLFAPDNTSAPSAYNQLVNDSDIIRGSKESKIVAVIFEDPQCPGCQSFSKNQSAELSKYNDRIKFVYKYLRAVSSHTFSKEANGLIYAAEKLDKKGYELAEKIYKDTLNQTTLDRVTVLKYAEELGLNRESLIKLAIDPSTETKVNQTQKDQDFKVPAIDNFTKSETRVQGTPSVIVFRDEKPIWITGGNDQSAFVNPGKNAAADLVSFLEANTK